MATSHTAAFFINPGVPLVTRTYPGAPKALAGQTAKLFDAIYGGHGRVAGTVKIKGTPDYAVYRKVRLFREKDGHLIAEQWSDAVTGAYSFDYVDERYTYTVIAYDYEHNFRAVVGDNVTPDYLA